MAVVGGRRRACAPFTSRTFQGYCTPATTPNSPKPSRSAAPRTERPEVSGKSGGDTLAALLPEKLDVVAHGGQESEYAYVVVDDGRARNLVQINVQYGMADGAGQLYAGGEILPDGTRLVTRQEPGEKAGPDVVM
ncbi:hypothetical protein [Streptomyces sp. AC627_RSS907]|uniref:hypothetical protein n=1 Tax=Streptomyces sp. AC627_RSS907 TaxID=2823684 RepID=UPI0020B7F412|nr:hypothetical protein [Streptomyces sp. AC627_RSS907]